MQITVDTSLTGKRLDAAIAAASALSRNAAQRLIENGAVFLGASPVTDKNYRVSEGEVFTLSLPTPEELTATPENIPLSIVYEDTDIIVVNKPKGMVVHPAPGSPSGTLVNALLYHCKGSLSGINGILRPGIVHRIDKDTSGLLVVAKNDEAHRALASQLEGHHIRRVYHALVNGGFSADTGTVDLPIGRSPVDRKKMAVLRKGQGHAREAVTHYEVLRRYGAITYLALCLETGRTHQIRVHMSHTGHPLLGDTVYGGGSTRFEKTHTALLSGQCLHAKELSFTHPRSGEEMHFETPLPDGFLSLLSILDATETR